MAPSPSPPDRLDQLRDRWRAEPSSRGFLQIAEEYRRVGRTGDALVLLDEGLRQQPGYLAALVAKGRCHLELGQAEAAREALERVVRQDPTQAVANKLLVRAYLEAGEARQARERLDLYGLLHGGDPEVQELKERIAVLERGPSPPAAAPADDVFDLSPRLVPPPELLFPGEEERGKA
ncbi:MAG: tetratricopeptide repeat protein, partial [Thermoanaerobaculia bacterium]